MILKDWLKCIDPLLVDVVIWTSDDREEPAFEGSVLDIPWYLVDYSIGRGEFSENEDEPIYFSIKKNENGVILPLIVINVEV